MKSENHSVIIPKMSYINTIKGLIHSSRLKPNTFMKDIDHKIQKINNIELKKMSVFNIKLMNGEEIDLQEDNLILTNNGFKYPSELTNHDLIFSESFNYIDKPIEKEIEWDNDINKGNYSINIPKFLNKDFSLWLGIFQSRGKKNKNRHYIGIEFFKGEEEFIELYILLTKKIFNITPLKRIEGNRVFYEFYSKNISKFFLHYFGKSFLKKIPSFIQEASLDNQIYFLAGLSLRGYSYKKYYVYFNGYSRNTADFVLNLLKSLGYSVFLKIDDVNNKKHYQVIVKGKHPFAKDIFSVNKKIELESLNSNFLIKNNDDIRGMKISSKEKGYSNFKKAIKKDIFNNSALKKVGIKYFFNEYYQEVKSINKIDGFYYKLYLKSDNGFIFKGFRIY